jgi:hypothetical protein
VGKGPAECTATGCLRPFVVFQDERQVDGLAGGADWHYVVWKERVICEHCGVEEVAGIESIAVNAKYWWHTCGVVQLTRHDRVQTTVWVVCTHVGTGNLWIDS